MVAAVPRTAGLDNTLDSRSPEWGDDKTFDWVHNLDYEAFKADVLALGKELERNQGQDDVDHIKKICLWSNMLGVLGLSTMWLAVNPVSVAAISLWKYSRWTTIAHHTCHGGYNRVDPTKFFNSQGFATGSLFKRATQWFDWMLPEAWNVEHNNLHHYRLSERDDPDVVEANTRFLREMKAPLPVKYALTAFFMATWKWVYYAPNTYKELKIVERRKQGLPVTEDMLPHEAFTLKTFAVDRWVAGAELPHEWYTLGELFREVLGPYLVGHFLLLPLPALALSPEAYGNAVATLVLAELLSNVHAFITIVTNHAGEDMYKFSAGCSPNSPTFFVRQIISSANFRTGGDVNDFMHGWLNYQIEHHVWPSLSALSYQRAAPRLRAICDRHGVPYVQESVWTRLRKTLDIIVGKTSMLDFPPALERPQDLKVWGKQESAMAQDAMLQQLERGTFTLARDLSAAE